MTKSRPTKLICLEGLPSWGLSSIIIAMSPFPRSRVSRSHNTSVKRTDSLHSFMRKHPVDQTPKAQTDGNEKTMKLIDCAKITVAKSMNECISLSTIS